MSIFGSFIDSSRQRQISKLGVETSRATRSADKAHSQASHLEARIGRLALACQALWELVCDSTGLSDETIESKLMEVDLRDGKPDGNIGSHLQTCRTCDRPVGKRHTKCIYRGEPIKQQHIFQQ